MWARVFEIALGLWLALSPFIFRHGAEDRGFWTNDLVGGFLITAFALLSFWRPLQHAHFATGAVALWLLVFGYLTGHPSPPASQNHIILGLLLLMFAIIPNHANLPPESWRRPANAHAEKNEG